MVSREVYLVRASMVEVSLVRVSGEEVYLMRGYPWRTCT